MIGNQEHQNEGKGSYTAERVGADENSEAGSVLPKKSRLPTEQQTGTTPKQKKNGQRNCSKEQKKNDITEVKEHRGVLIQKTRIEKIGVGESHQPPNAKRPKNPRSKPSAHREKNRSTRPQFEKTKG